MLVRSCHGCSGVIKMSHMNWKVFLGGPRTVQKSYKRCHWGVTVSKGASLYFICLQKVHIRTLKRHNISSVHISTLKEYWPINRFCTFFCVYKCIVVYWYCHKPIIHCDTKVCLCLQGTLLKSYAFCMIRLIQKHVISSKGMRPWSSTPNLILWEKINPGFLEICDTVYFLQNLK